MMHKLHVELDRCELIDLVKSTGGPKKEDNPFDLVGGYYQPFYQGSAKNAPKPHWKWDESFLNRLSLKELYGLFRDIQRFNGFRS